MVLQPDELRERLVFSFEENFKRSGEIGAAVSVWQDGKPVGQLHRGFRDAGHSREWTSDTLVLIWSATKGPAAACLLHVLQEHDIDLKQRVVEFWPEFSTAGKERITLAELLSHQAGLAALDADVDILNYHDVIEAIEKQKPNWPPGTAHGYHPRTFGFLLDELVRRIAHSTLSEYWRASFGEPLGLDLWIGLPEAENSRVATIYPAKASKSREENKRQSGPPVGQTRPVASSDQFYKEVATRGTFAHKVFNSPRGLRGVSAMNKPEIRRASIVAFGGIGSAQSLAKFYAMLANAGQFGGRQFFSEKVLGWMTTTLTDGIDRVFQIPTAFSAGFMKDSRSSTRRVFGPSLSSFGHPGAGGSHAFADPENKIGFAYVMNQMEQSVLPGDRALRLVDAVYRK